MSEPKKHVNTCKTCDSLYSIDNSFDFVPLLVLYTSDLFYQK